MDKIIHNLSIFLFLPSVLEKAKKGTMMHHLYIDVREIRKTAIIDNFYFENNFNNNFNNDAIDKLFSLEDFYKIKHVVENRHDNLFKVFKHYTIII